MFDVCGLLIVGCIVVCGYCLLSLLRFASVLFVLWVVVLVAVGSSSRLLLSLRVVCWLLMSSVFDCCSRLFVVVCSVMLLCVFVCCLSLVVNCFGGLCVVVVPCVLFDVRCDCLWFVVVVCSLFVVCCRLLLK